MDKILKTAINVYGIKMQSLIAVEEMAELQKEIIKLHRGKPNINNLAEEIADVTIMIDQLIYGLNCKDKVNEYRQEKINRLEDRIRKENENE